MSFYDDIFSKKEARNPTVSWKSGPADSAAIQQFYRQSGLKPVYLDDDRIVYRSATEADQINRIVREGKNENINS